jgi:hypothetical protein
VLFKGKAGEDLTKGDAVYISGISGNTTVVSKADASNAAKMPAFGLVSISASNNSACEIVTFGTLSGIDTSTFTEGDEVYIGTTPGALVVSPPSGESNQIQKIGKVTRSDNSAGSLKVMGAGRTNAVPNLDNGNVFIGSSSNQAEIRQLLESDISDLQTYYLASNPNNYISSYTVTESDVTQHEAALSITESQISDLQTYYLASNPNNYISSYTVTESDVTQHQAALSITESQISDLQTYYLASNPNNYISSYTVTESDVTQHQAALSITESQISDLQTYYLASNPNNYISSYTVTESDVTQHEAALSITESQISDLQSYQLLSQKGAASGYASLDGAGKVPTTQLPALALTEVSVVANQAARLALTAQEGDVAIQTDTSTTFIHNGGTAGTTADWEVIEAPVTEVDPVFTASTAFNISNGTGFLKNNGSGVWSYDNSTYLTSYTVTENDVTQHEAALSITESQISDLQTYYLASNPNNYISSYTVTENDVTQHEAALSITESQISDLQGYLTSEADTLATVTGRGNTTTNAVTVGSFTSTGIDDNSVGTHITLIDDGGDKLTRFEDYINVREISSQLYPFTIIDSTTTGNLTFNMRTSDTGTPRIAFGDTYRTPRRVELSTIIAMIL